MLLSSALVHQDSSRYQLFKSNMSEICTMAFTRVEAQTTVDFVELYQDEKSTATLSPRNYISTQLKCNSKHILLETQSLAALCSHHIFESMKCYIYLLACQICTLTTHFHYVNSRW